MTFLSPRNRLIGCLVLAGVGLALFFSGQYRDLPLMSREFPVGWLGACLFVAAVWFCVGLLHRVPRSDEETAIAPGEWQAWIGVAFVGAVIVATVLKQHVFQLQAPIGHNPGATVAGRSIGTLFVAWLVLVHVLKKRWAGTVLEDERDVRIKLVASQWARGATAVCVIGIALMLGFTDPARLRGFSYAYIAQLLVQALLWGLWFEQAAAAVLYLRDRRAMA